MKVKAFRYLIITLVTSVLLVLAFCINSVSIARGLEPNRATFAAYSGNIRVFPNGRAPSRTPRAHRELRKTRFSRDHLWVAGDSRSWANLQFWSRSQRVGPLIRAGTNRTNTRYIFPCRIRGGSARLAWGLRPLGTSACEGIVVSASSNDDRVASKAYSHAFTNGTLTSQLTPSDEITITRLEEQTFIHIYRQDNELTVDVLVGAVQIIGLNGVVVEIGAGERYIQFADTETLESLNLEEAFNSPSVESFLDTENWSPDVEQFLNDLRLQNPGTSITSASSQLTEEEQEILNAHNQLRDEVNVPPLSWSPELATTAQEWADELSGRRNLEHSPTSGGRSGAGENLAAGSSVELMLSLWAREKRDFDPSTGQCRSGSTCGHYTQMIWRNTTEVGCGIAPHRRYGRVMVCNYRPPGNFIGQSPL